MKNSDNNHQEYEKSWQDAFEGAEMMPSEDVWIKIDGALANQDSSKFKRKVALYKYAAAISLLMLIGGGLITYFFINENMILKSEVSGTLESQNESESANNNSSESEISRNDSELAESKEKDNSSLTPGNNSKDEILEKSLASTGKEKTIIDDTKSQKDAEEAVVGNSTSTRGTESNHQKQSYSPAIADQNQISTNESFPENRIAEIDSQENLNSELSNNQYLISGSQPSIDRNSVILAFAPSKGFEELALSTEKVQREIYRVPDYRLAYSRKKSENKDFYAGLSFTPNVFDPNIQMNSGNLESAALNQNSNAIGVNPRSQEQNIRPQMSYAYGLNFGFKLSKKWILHSGLQYAKNNTVSSTNSFLQPDFNSNVRYAATPVTLNKLSNDGLSPEKLGFTQPVSQMIELNNNFEFASIPVKAGYIIVDKKLTWVVSTGVGTDIFLNNRQEDQQNQFVHVTIKPGESSPYRHVYFNGLASSEVIYNFARNISFSLEPSFRIAINSFSKSDSYITSLPQSFGVAAGFRYHFRK